MPIAMGIYNNNKGSYEAHNLLRNLGAQKRDRTNKLHLRICKSFTKKMGYEMFLELRERLNWTKTVWKRVPDSSGSEMK